LPDGRPTHLPPETKAYVPTPNGEQARERDVRGEEAGVGGGGGGGVAEEGGGRGRAARGGPRAARRGAGGLERARARAAELQHRLEQTYGKR
jgi:hypothetical protein